MSIKKAAPPRLSMLSLPLGSLQWKITFEVEDYESKELKNARDVVAFVTLILTFYEDFGKFALSQDMLGAHGLMVVVGSSSETAPARQFFGLPRFKRLIS